MQNLKTFFKKMSGRKSTFRSREKEKNSNNNESNKTKNEDNVTGSLLLKRSKPSSSKISNPPSSSSSSSTSHLKTLQMRLRSQSSVNNSNFSLRSKLTQITTPTVNSTEKLYGAKKKNNSQQQQQNQEEHRSVSTTATTTKRILISEIRTQQSRQSQQKLKKFEIMGVNNVALLYKDLKAEWSKKNCNLQKCGSYLDQLKIELTKLSYLPTEGIPIPKQDLIVARDILEIAVEYSVAKKDIPAFERYISQLKCYYYDYRQIIGESDNMYKLLGLNLLYLLSVNRVSEFHTELELLSTEVIQRNRYIRPILALEQYIMEGRYNKIFQARGSLPTDLYNFFMDILVETVRDEIGACLERSYEKISLQEAAKRLNLKNKEEVKTFGAKRNWNLGSDDVYYFMAKAAKPKEPLPSIELAEQAMFYARELEMIV